MTATPNNRPESPADLIQLLRVTDIPLPDGDTGAGLKFHTNRGEFPAIIHRANPGPNNSDAPGANPGPNNTDAPGANPGPNNTDAPGANPGPNNTDAPGANPGPNNTDAPGANRGPNAVIWVCGARGGFGGPGPGTYARLAEQLTHQGITSLRLDYRFPNDLLECVLDLLTGVAYFQQNHYPPLVVVGHSFGGAVVIAAAAASPHIKGVVSLSPQTYGAGLATQLSPRKLLLVHGKADTRLPYTCAQQIHEWAKEPKELVLYEGAEHRLEECRSELETLLSTWIPATLAEAITIPTP